MSPRPTFDPEDFTTLGGGHGAGKLASAAVAPLVAAARGYETVFPDEVREAASRHRLGSMNSAAGRKLRQNVGEDDAMIMPWFRLDETLDAGGKKQIAKSTSIQLRPSQPLPPVRQGDKPRKYDLFAGAGTELDLHPATPWDWNETAPTAFFTEGLIKGDAALTGMLRAAGISDSDLANTHPDGDPAAELRALMAQVPKNARVVIISFVGVGNWKQRGEWAMLKLSGRHAWIAFDADAGENLQVWSQANQLTGYLEGKNMKQVHLVNLGLTSEQAAARKVGVDDFLAEFGRWEDLPAALTNLPDRPKGKDEGTPGQWRVTEDGLAVEAAEAAKNPDGTQGPAFWVQKVPIGGRVSKVESMRQPTKTEMRTGVIQPGQDDPDTRVELELSWADPVSGQTRSGTVTGPAVILAYPPKDWDRKGGHMPTSLLQHPQWPPEKGLEWLRAIKGHRLADVETNVRWKSMGWAPGPSEGLPSYIAGNTVVTEAGVSDDLSGVGVSDDILSGASNFGVIAPDDDEWKAQARADLEEVFDAYITSQAWQQPQIAATVLGIGLRPAIPILPRTVAYFVGARRSGKSFTASFCMSFWQPRPGTWGGDQLPGSAKDTIASMEHSVAHSNIWVSDDLAPSSDRNQASREEASMGDLIRSIHNGIGKRRMNADMTAREVNNPRALLIVTAENEPSVSSVGDRMVLLKFGDGALHPSTDVTDRLVDMRDTGGQPARLAQAFIRWHLMEAAKLTGGWQEMVQGVEDDRARCEKYAASVLAGQGDEGSATRHAVMAADVMVTLLQLSQMAKWLGAKDIFRQLQMASLPKQVALQVAKAHDAQRTTSPGQRVMQAVSLLLTSNQAHVASLEDPNSPPATDQAGADLINRQLGWVKTGGEWRPSGPRIGWLTTGRDRKTEVVLLEQHGAFTEAQRRHPALLPYGQKPATAWASAWDEDLTVPENNPEGEPLGWSRHNNGRSTQQVVRVTCGDQAVTGVPVLMSVLLGGPRWGGGDEPVEPGQQGRVNLRAVS